MKKILGVVTIVILVCAVCGYLFNLGEFDFFENLARVSTLEFNNPIQSLIDLIKKVQSISEWGSYDIAWYEYIPKFFGFLGDLLLIPIEIVKDIAIDLFNGLRAVLYFLGFNF